jgi:hypothetical protein
MELDAFFYVPNTPLKVDTPIELAIVYNNINDYDR